MKRIIVNGEARAISGVTIAAILEEIGMGEAKVATALNGDFVPAGARIATKVHEGDALEVVAPMQGG